MFPQLLSAAVSGLRYNGRSAAGTVFASPSAAILCDQRDTAVHRLAPAWSSVRSLCNVHLTDRRAVLRKQLRLSSIASHTAAGPVRRGARRYRTRHGRAATAAAAPHWARAVRRSPHRAAPRRRCVVKASAAGDLDAGDDKALSWDFAPSRGLRYIGPFSGARGTVPSAHSWHQ